MGATKHKIIMINSGSKLFLLPPTIFFTSAIGAPAKTKRCLRYLVERTFLLLIMKDLLPVPDQLSKQLAKCKSIRDADTHYKSREKTPQVSHQLLHRVGCYIGWMMTCM